MREVLQFYAIWLIVGFILWAHWTFYSSKWPPGGDGL